MTEDGEKPESPPLLIPRLLPPVADQKASAPHLGINDFLLGVYSCLHLCVVLLQLLLH